MLYAEEFIDLLRFTDRLSQEDKFTYGASLTTNGTLISVDMLDALIEARCNQIQITIDGDKTSHDATRKFKDESGSYDRLLEIINKVMKAKIIGKSFIFVLRVNLLNNTLDEFASLLRDIAPELRPQVNLLIRPIYSTETFDCKNANDLDHLKIFYDKASEMGFPLLKSNHHYRSCEACNDVNTLIICPDLTVRKCINSMSFDPAKIGQLSLSGQLELDPCKVINWYNAASCFADTACRACKLLPDCFGGCIVTKIKTGKRRCSTFESAGLRNTY